MSCTSTTNWESEATRRLAGNASAGCLVRRCPTRQEASAETVVPTVASTDPRVPCDLANAVLTTVVEVGRQAWTPQSASARPRLLRRTAGDRCGPTHPPEKRMPVQQRNTATCPIDD